jgi:hypothetical protein
MLAMKMLKYFWERLGSQGAAIIIVRKHQNTYHLITYPQLTGDPQQYPIIQNSGRHPAAKADDCY